MGSCEGGRRPPPASSTAPITWWLSWRQEPRRPGDRDPTSDRRPAPPSAVARLKRPDPMAARPPQRRTRSHREGPPAAAALERRERGGEGGHGRWEAGSMERGIEWRLDRKRREEDGGGERGNR
jgi:hypothetical protein